MTLLAERGRARAWMPEQRGPTNEKHKYRAALRRVEKLTPAVLAKAFRGELVEQDPTDEPAERMLERIRAQRAQSDGAASGRADAKAASRKNGGRR